jgi:restriction system protein
VIPDFQSMMRPLLEELSDGSTRKTRELVQALSDRFGLTVEEREALLPSGRQRRMDNRVAWAISHLFQAGLLERPARATSPSPKPDGKFSSLIRTAST